MSVVNENPRTTTNRYDGPVAPIVGTILVVIGWLVFILVYALEWSKNYSLFQNIIVTIVTLMIAGLVIGAVWVGLTPKGYWRGGY